MQTISNGEIEVETPIIGGGIAGLACAPRLSDAGSPFTLVTDLLGGRMAASDDGINLGAVMGPNC